MSLFQINVLYPIAVFLSSQLHYCFFSLHPCLLQHRLLLLDLVIKAFQADFVHLTVYAVTSINDSFKVAFVF